MKQAKALKKRPLLLTCTLCSNYDPNRALCKLNGERRKPITYEHAAVCKEKGQFVRYMHVLPDTYNYFKPDEEVPTNWRYHEIDKISTDVSGAPLIVYTKRGAERAVKANESIREMKTDFVFGVPRILTYQGQRELIYELGVEIAKDIAREHDIELTILPEEEGWPGIEHYQKKHFLRNNHSNVSSIPWLSDEPIEEWN
ncbi:hypothetical protein AM501_05295 [Aneurinibacillus migulanus]|uniref:hypothetical protein n=1 Tax=Aneurinibacillus migulanus TaxID=47500 RepID=UPI0005BDD853|nr:hypothetical protein [Aneurinibacillus migulanus]KIV58576.1 hypothetical protein TS64_04320 [Aneurinibacillus migulanus]KPD09252.1 hypothetical protein AM501_05295 [Aneurinibacillus migulanus]